MLRLESVVLLLSLTFALCTFVKFCKIVIWELQLEIKPYTDLTRWNASRREKYHEVIMPTFYAQKELKKKSALMLFWLSMLVHKTTDKTNCIDHQVILCSYQWVKFPSLGWTNSHSQQSVVQHWASSERVPTNFVHFPQCRRHILAGYLGWLAI